MTTALLERIQRMSAPIPFTGCWIWTGATARGYGQLTHEGRHMTAHRASWIASNPGEPAPRLVCHHCDVRACVNPDHLYSGDYLSNRADMLSRQRWSHPFAKREACSAGHRYDEVGFAIAADGSRVCRECQRINKRKQRARKELK